MIVIESNACFGPIELGYYRVGEGSDWYTKWIKGPKPPDHGFKIHISACAEDADIVARHVLPILRRLYVFHKVVIDLDCYRKLLAGSQKGKFITIYTLDAQRAQRVLDEIDPELMKLRQCGIVKPGPTPTTRHSHHQTEEISVGGSGLIWTYYY